MCSDDEDKNPAMECPPAFIQDGHSQFKYCEHYTSGSDSLASCLPAFPQDDHSQFKYWEHSARDSNSLERPCHTLTHVDSVGQAKMVDVGGKTPSERRAVAEALVWLGPEVFALVLENRLQKGDVLGVARIAGVMGAKATPNLIPLCHPLPLTHVTIDTTLVERNYSVRIVASARTLGVTGVEMEALTGACVAALTVYDMCKAVSHGIVIGDVKLLSKTGGKNDFDGGQQHPFTNFK